VFAVNLFRQGNVSLSYYRAVRSLTLCYVIVCVDSIESDPIDLDNKVNTLFLASYEPSVQGEVTNSYIRRELWQQLDDPIYKDQGGIFAIMSKTVIDNIATGIAA
jgi:hypothetical protein